MVACDTLGFPKNMTKMKYLLIIASLAIAKAGVIKEETCDGVLINNTYYEKETIKTDLDRPYLLAIDSSTNTLYFSYSVNQDDDVFKTAKIELNTNTFNNIDILNGFAQTVDEMNNDVFIGSNDGIYKYDHDTNQVEFIGQRGSDIWALFYKDVLYYSEFPSQFLYTYSNGTAVRYKDLEDTKVDHFLIDKEDTMFFTNITGLFSQKKGTKDAVSLEKFPKGGPRGMNMNKDGDVFVCMSDGIHKVNKEQSSLEKIVALDDCFGIAFDKDNNFVYADWKSLYRLKPSDKTC